ncbi:Gfo/Idh/MocA family oxidoreductase [Arthrobacter sp. Z1-9]
MTARSAGPAKIAIIGVSHWHLPLYLPGFESADVIGVWDSDWDRANQVAQIVQSTPYDSREALLEQDIDLAFIFGDPWDMLNSARECVRRSINFSVEKPAAPSLGELERLTADAECAGVRAFVPLVLRAGALPGLISQLGQVLDMHAQYLTGPADRYIAEGAQWAVTESVLGAGSVGNLAPHFVDLFSLAVGVRDHAVQFLTASHPGRGEADDRAHIVLRSSGGVSAAINVGYTTQHSTFCVGPRVVLTGTRATLVVDEVGAELLRPDGSTTRDLGLQWRLLYPAYVRALLANADGEGQLPLLSELRDTYRVLQGTSISPDGLEQVEVKK